MGNSISIRVFVGTPDGTSYDTGKDDGGRGASPAQLNFITFEIGDIDFSPGGKGTNNFGSSLLDKGDIDFQPVGNASCSSRPGNRNPSGTPDDIVNDFLKDLAGNPMMQPFLSFLSKVFGKQDEDKPAETAEGVSPSKRQKAPNQEGQDTEPPASSKRKRANNDEDVNPETSPPPKRPKAGKEDDVKPSAPSANGSTSVSGSSPAGAVLPPHKGEVEVNEPIIVGPNEVFDGKNKLFKAGPGLNGGGTAETQDPVFILAPGAQLKNVQFEGGDGIHLLGDAKLDNVHAVHGGPDDMITIDGPGNKARDAKLAGIPLGDIPNKPAEVEIVNSSFRHSHDKAIQVNGDANIKLKGIYAEDVGQLLVTLGGQPITAHVSIEDSNIKDLRSHLFRLDSHNSTLDIGPDVKTDNGLIQVMMGDPGKASGATRVMPSTSRA